ncbi:AsnC family protein [Haloactinomyces albus]|uniref:AsnC family protein n=1 Tax=Haloactinomyces albus TaxID=1352928 RepID=A0AAE3ZCE6_9ACTN|nr:AsnC family protein [Haloactinomyces albus]MDR7300554.1 hypothetical protein [Haloactinomyces albus]
MTAPDPVDIRLLTFIAETGRAAVHEIAGHLGMDVRDVAARFAALSTSGLPLLVGVECDPQGIRHALATAGAWGHQSSGPYPVGPGGSRPADPQSGGFSGGHPVHSGPSGPHPSGPYPSGPYPSQSGPHPGKQPAAQQPAAPQSPPQPLGPGGFPPGSGPVPQQAPGPNPAPPQAGPHQAGSTWGPPGSASWVRGNSQAAAGAPAAQQTPSPPPPPPRSGTVGSTLEIEGLEGERIGIKLVEVVDPADFLFSAAGHELQEGQRAVVVHTELTNGGVMPFTSLPDLYLVLVAEDGSAIAKAPMSLSSRPPHQIGVSPGETAGGHTVYVLSESTTLSAVRWMLRPGDGPRTLTWDITDL